MTNHEQKARELAERCAEKIHPYQTQEWFNEIEKDRQWRYQQSFMAAQSVRKEITETILRSLNLAKLVEDEAMVDWLENMYHSTGFLLLLNQDARTAIRNAMKEGGK